jgi:hypothetical protein
MDKGCTCLIFIIISQVLVTLILFNSSSCIGHLKSSWVCKAVAQDLPAKTEENVTIPQLQQPATRPKSLECNY